MTRHDELVEEIAGKIRARAKLDMADIEAEPHSVFAPLIEAEIRSRVLARELIKSTLKAVVDGMPLDPWEVGRTEAILTPNKWGGQSLEEGDYLRWLYDMLSRDARLFIALSPAGIPVGRKEGTFLEEAVRNLEAHRKRLEEWLAKKQIGPTGTGEEE